MDPSEPVCALRFASARSAIEVACPSFRATHARETRVSAARRVREEVEGGCGGGDRSGRFTKDRPWRRPRGPSPTGGSNSQAWGGLVMVARAA
jgi:hypothetical protein